MQYRGQGLGIQNCGKMKMEVKGGILARGYENRTEAK